MTLPERASITRQDIPDTMFRRACWLVRESGVAQRVTDDLDTGRTGRPRTLPWETFFVGLVLATILSNGHEIRLTGATRALLALTPQQRRSLGIEHVTLHYSQLESGLTDLVTATKHRTRNHDGHTTHVGPRLTMTITDIVNEFLRGARVEGLPRTGHYAIDSTDQPTRARRRTRSTLTNPTANDDTDSTMVEAIDDTTSRIRRYLDPTTGRHYPYLGENGRWRHTPDPDATDGYRAGKGLRHKDVFAGYDIHIITDCGTPGHPAFPVAMFTEPAGNHKGEAGLRLIRDLTAAGITITDIYADRGYSHCTPERWAAPLATMGIANHHDMHPRENRVHTTDHQGVIMVDGAYFVARLPTRLRTLSRPGLGATDAQRRANAAEFDKRIPYAFKIHSTKTGGTVRYRGPALTHEVRCPNNPASMRLPRNRPLMTCSPAGCSCSKTFSVKASDLRDIKHRQPHLYGTTKWLEAYGRRNLIESFNATLKEHGTHLSERSFQVFGLPKVTLLTGLVMAVAALNILLVRYGCDPSCPDLAPTPGEVLVPVPRERKPHEVPKPPPVAALLH